MKRACLLFFTILFMGRALAQNCDCEKELDFVRSYMERNHPGLNSGTKKTTAYKNGLAAIRKEIRLKKPGADCNLYLEDYISLLKDHHAFIRTVIPRVNIPDRNSTTAMDSFFHSAAFLSSPKRSIDTTELKNHLQNKNEGIEGLYWDGGGNLIAIVKEPAEDWAYKGIMIRTANSLFPVGSVRYEFKERPGGKLWASVLLPDHQNRVYASVLVTKKGIPGIGLKRMNESAATSGKPYEFRMLNDSTAYVRVSSFDGELYSELQSFYASIENNLRSTAFLIIDIRDNSGGSEMNYQFFKNLMVSGPVKYGRSEIWVSPDNIKRYEENLEFQKKNADKFSAESIERTEKLIAMMKVAKQFSFLKYGEATTVVPDTILALPKKIALLMNRNCASSAEGFIAFAQQSSKVITMGENSGGYVGYGDVLPVKTPCYGYTLGNTILRFNQYYKYEFTGIPPQKRLDTESDWLLKAQDILSKNH